jgi:hypothetical protein
MQLSAKFQSYISFNAHGSREPVELKGQAHKLDSDQSFGQELWDAVSLSGGVSTIKTNAQRPELAGKEAEVEKILSMLKPPNERAAKAANQILAQVQGSLAGLPAAFGMAETDVHGDQPFYVRIHEAKEPAGRYKELDPASVEAVVYVDPSTSSYYVDSDPGDRWSPNYGPFDGAALVR